MPKGLRVSFSPPRGRLSSSVTDCAFTDLMDQLLGCSAAAPNHFFCQSALDVVVCRLDDDASQFAFGITFQLACVD